MESVMDFCNDTELYTTLDDNLFPGNLEDIFSFDSEGDLTVPLSQNFIKTEFEPIVAHFDKYPVIDDYDTDYNFTVQLVQPNSEKNFVFSKDLNKVFIKECNPLAVQVAFSPQNKPHLFLRAMIVYSSPENMPLAVQKCHNHKNRTESCSEESKPHILRSPYPNTKYCGIEDGVLFKDRLSVVIPIDFQASGTSTKPIIKIPVNFEFTCQNSCATGMNRRMTSVIFTLEDEIFTILGRKSMLFKVCSCPKRDKQKEEETHHNSGQAKQSKQPKKKCPDPPPPGKMLKRIKLETVESTTVSNDSADVLTPNPDEVCINIKFPNMETAERILMQTHAEYLRLRENNVQGMESYINDVQCLLSDLNK